MNTPTSGALAQPDAPKSDPNQPSRASVLRGATLLLALICFLLPFIKLSCVQDPNAGVTFTGTDLCLGTQVKDQDGDARKVEPQPPIIAAAVATGLAMILAFAGQSAAGGLASLAAVGSLLYFFLTERHSLRSQSRGLMQIEMEIGMILALILLLIGALLCFAKLGQRRTASLPTSNPNSDTG